MRRSILVVLLSAFLWLGCGDSSSPESSQEVPTAEESLKLYVFDCGGLRFDSISIFGMPDDATTVRDLIVPCYMVEHPNGRLLWDGGLPSSVSEVEGWQDAKGFQMRLDEPLAAQLAKMDLDMISFDYVAFSHFHYDHVGVANELEGATLIIQRPEQEAAFAEPVTVPFFDFSLYENLKDAEHLVVDGDHDVFGDGRVRIISAPGHTPGHQVLFLDLAATGPIVLSGDLYHFRVSREKKFVPEFNFDAEMTRKSMQRVEGFLQESGATLWIEHDLALFEELKKAPAYYE